MSQKTVEYGDVLRALGHEEQRPDSEFEGLLHHIEFDWSAFSGDVAVFCDQLRKLAPVVGPRTVIEIAGQLAWRVPDGPEAEASFLRAVFGEVRHAG